MLYSLVFVRDVNISFYYICKEEKKSILKKILLLEVTLVHWDASGNYLKNSFQANK